MQTVFGGKGCDFEQHKLSSPHGQKMSEMGTTARYKMLPQVKQITHCSVGTCWYIPQKLLTFQQSPNRMTCRCFPEIGRCTPGIHITHTSLCHVVPLMCPPLLPAWSGQIRGVVCHQGYSYTQVWDLAPDFGSLHITGGIAQQRGCITGGALYQEDSFASN